MKQIDFYLDFVSPFAYLALMRLPEELKGLSYLVHHKPFVLGAVLKTHQNPGPAGIPPKRDWTYRHCAWLGQTLGIPFQMPAQHPFNPIGLMRLALATSNDGSINRHVAATIFQHVFVGGADANAVDRLPGLQAKLNLHHSPQDEAVKAMLRQNTDMAQKAGVFGAPAFVVDGKVFWGFDSLPMLAAYLRGEPWFEAHWNDPAGIQDGLKPVA